MKPLLFIYVQLFLAFSLLSQKDKFIYFDTDWKETTKENALYYRNVNKDVNGMYQVTDYFMDGTVQMTGQYSDKQLKVKQGEFNYFDNESHKTTKSNYLNGQHHGIYEEYYPENKLKISSTYKNGESNGEYTEYYPDGSLRAKTFFENDYIKEKAERFAENGAPLLSIKLDDKRSGTLITYHENGTPKRTGNFYEGFRNDEWKNYDSTGKITNTKVEKEILDYKKMLVTHEIEQNKKRKENFRLSEYHSVEDEFMRGFDFPSKNNIVDFPDVEAEYPGGAPALQLYIAQNVRFPEKAIKKNIQGKAYLSFVVEIDGSISNVRYLLGPEIFKSESIRLVSSMPKWSPGQAKGKPVRTRCQIPINYTIN